MLFINKEDTLKLRELLKIPCYAKVLNQFDAKGSLFFIGYVTPQGNCALFAAAQSMTCLIELLKNPILEINNVQLHSGETVLHST